ncbi:MAG: cytochrome ubiquinol oxidase subunit I [Planctomycetia bacterium]|nr:cytochrome ubiquinol oxidase subunit I [Planctomycetia bacterium]
MDYLWWYVPWITSPMLIALIATVHVFVSHYAVGGGLFLAWETGYAYKTGNVDYETYLRHHTKFFVPLTVVFGAITGVGIWWTIGLASPHATEILIRTFVFGWATEWVLFLVEIVAAFLFLYRWGQIPKKTHLAIGWIYALAAWGSLVLITGITAFMLHSGDWVAATHAGTGEPHFWLGFFNPQFLPQTVARTGASLVLAVTYVLLHAAFFLRENQTELRKLVIRRTSGFTLAGLLLTAVGVFWSGWNLPPMAQATLQRAAALNLLIGVGTIAAGLLTLFLLLAWYRPQWLTPLGGLAIFVLALGTLATGEFVREAVRKPYIIHQVLLGNQIHVSKISELRKNGLLQSGIWTRRYVEKHFPYLVTPEGNLDLRGAKAEDRYALGEMVFMHHCNDCHARTFGYSGLGALATTRSREELLAFLQNLDGMIYYMPPWCGNDAEAELLADYLRNTAYDYPRKEFPHAVD